jgi:hypothetical protein
MWVSGGFPEGHDAVYTAKLNVVGIFYFVFLVESGLILRWNCARSWLRCNLRGHNVVMLKLIAETIFPMVLFPFWVISFRFYFLVVVYALELLFS